MLNAFSAAALLVYPGLGQAWSNAGLHLCWLGSYPVAWLNPYN